MWVYVKNETLSFLGINIASLFIMVSQIDIPCYFCLKISLQTCIHARKITDTGVGISRIPTKINPFLQHLFYLCQLRDTIIFMFR